MDRDPVCGMEVEPNKVDATSEYDGNRFVFCSASCKSKFDRDPRQYVDNN